MRIAILGFGLEGHAAYDYFRGIYGGAAEVVICDQKQDPIIPTGVTADMRLGRSYLTALGSFDVIVRSPFVKPSDILALNPGVEDKITSNTNEFLRACFERGIHNIIGVTGTKGKGTTSTLITRLLEATGKRVHFGGNVGVPALELFKDDIGKDDYVVLELSSYQLSDLRYSPHTAVCLMVVPEHLDWHVDFDDYISAKQNLFRHQTTEDTAVYYADNKVSERVAEVSPGHKIAYFTDEYAHVNDDKIMYGRKEIMDTSELGLIGKHNWQNVCAALTAVWSLVSDDLDAVRDVLRSFTGLPHRIEFVRSVNDVRFYNDSFASGLHATEAAIEAVPGKKVAILGGFDRGIPLEHFGTYAQEHANEFRKLFLIGASAGRLAETLQEKGFNNFEVDSNAKTMAEIVKRSRDLAEPGDAVLFSPGFASFDMFKNFEDRGEQFRDTVNRL